MLIKISIPIHNYYSDGVFYQDIYFETDHSPTKEEVLTYLQSQHNQDSQYEGYLGDWQDCIISVNASEDWPFVGGRKVGSNTFVNREDLKVFEDHLPLSMGVINPHRL